MTDLIIRNLNDATMAVLQARAQSHGRSVEEEARALLESEAARRPTRAELAARADRIRAMTPRDVDQTDSTLMVREDRESR